MFIKFLLFYISILPSIVDCYCYSKSSQIWICNNRTKSTNFDYEYILNHYEFKKFFLQNYQLLKFKIDNYPLKLSLFNASHNQFETIIITSKNHQKSNLHQLILQSNSIRYFNMSTISLPQSLEMISLANNHLEILDARIFLSLKNLTKLDLRNNQLKRILPELLLSNRNIQFNNNPLNCQCTPEFYRILCEKSTNLKQSILKSNNCMAPYYKSQPYDIQSSSYLRYSKFILICPINSQPPPIIIWSTPFGNLTSINSSEIDLLSTTNDEPIYLTLKVFVGPLTARTQHELHAFNLTHLSITQARASLQYHFSCTGINMLGTYTYKFHFHIDTLIEKHALWYILYTLSFGFFMSLIAGALCITLKRTNYSYSNDHMKTPPIYPTLVPNSASRTPPNFELNQWLSLAAANISETLEQVRDKLRLGVQHVSEHMGRASELFTHGVQQAGGTIRQAAETSAAYLQSLRETSQQRLNTMRVQTSSSLPNSGPLKHAGINILTTQVDSSRDYCGMTTDHSISINYFLQQLQQKQNFPLSTIIENNENIHESIPLINSPNHSIYAGNIPPSNILINASGIGQLDTADNSVLLALNNFNMNQLEIDGQMSSGIGTFHHHEELIIEPERLTIYGPQRPFV